MSAPDEIRRGGSGDESRRGARACAENPDPQRSEIRLLVCPAQGLKNAVAEQRNIEDVPAILRLAL
jgi:hypothetical protein